MHNNIWSVYNSEILLKGRAKPEKKRTIASKVSKRSGNGMRKIHDPMTVTLSRRSAQHLPEWCVHTERYKVQFPVKENYDQYVGDEE